MQRIIFFLVFFIPLQALAEFDGNSALERAEKSIWRICGSVIENCGTGFFIDKNTFITNLHVIDSNLLEDRFDEGRHIKLSEFYLTQKDTEEELSLKSVRSLSIPYDLIALETNQTATDYLSLTGDSDYDSVFSMSYAQKKFTKAYGIGDILYKDDYIFKFIALITEGADDLSMEEGRFRGASGSPILNRKAEVVGVLTKAHYNLLVGMTAGLLNNMLKADESSGIGSIDCKELDINSCFMKHKKIVVEYINVETSRLAELSEGEELVLGFYLYSFSERIRAILEIFSPPWMPIQAVQGFSFYSMFLEMSVRLNYQPAVLRRDSMYGSLFRNKKKLYDLIVSSDHFILLPNYINLFFENETEDRKKTLETRLISCAERRFYPCESALGQFNLRRRSIPVE